MNSETRWIRLTHAENIPLREGRAVEVGGRELAVFNLGDRFLTISNRCPHKNGPLADGIVSGDTVVCPLHATRFSLATGQGVRGPGASGCVETFRTRVEDGVVMVELPPAAAAQDPDLACTGACAGHSPRTAAEESNF